jgi:hypothetical protein
MGGAAVTSRHAYWFYRGWERACLLRGIDWRRAWETDLIAIRCQRAHTRAQRAVHREWNIR